MLPTLRNRTTRVFLPNLVDEFFNNDLFPGFFEPDSKLSLPAVNITEGKEAFKIEVAVPGLNKEDFRINLDNNVLTISSEKEEKNEEKDDKVMRREFNYCSFTRAFTLPSTVNADKIKASHKDGILTISLPKKEEAKEKPAREIKIA